MYFLCFLIGYFVFCTDLREKPVYILFEVFMKILVIFYSMYGHAYRMAEAVAEGAREVPGSDVALRRVPETVPQEILAKSGALEAQKQFAHIPIVELDELATADGILFGTPYTVWPCL